MTFQWLGWEEAAGKSHILDRRIFQYVASARELAKREHVAGLPTDKATVGSMPLQVSMLVLPTGHPLLCCPQALVVSSASGLLGVDSSELWVRRRSQKTTHRIQCWGAVVVKFSFPWGRKFDHHSSAGIGNLGVGILLVGGHLFRRNPPPPPPQSRFAERRMTQPWIHPPAAT